MYSEASKNAPSLKSGICTQAAMSQDVKTCSASAQKKTPASTPASRNGGCEVRASAIDRAGAAKGADATRLRSARFSHRQSGRGEGG